jgi:PAS domain S-box-containing protein
MNTSEPHFVQTKPLSKATRARLAVDHTPNMVLWVLEEGEIVDANKTAEKLGYSQAQLCALSLLDILADMDAEQWAKYWQMAQDQEKLELETQCCQKDGRSLPVRLCLKVIEHKDQTYGLLFINDASKEAEKNGRAATKQALKEIELLAQVNELNRELNQALSESSVFDTVAHYIPQIIEADRTSIALLTEDGEHFQLYGLTDEVEARTIDTIYPLADTNIERAIRENRLIVELNMRNDFLPHLLSHMNAPLVIGGKAIGTLNVGSKEANAYSAHDQQILLQIASLLASNINQRLLAQTESALAATADEARRMELLNEMGQQMNLAGSESDIFDVANRYTPLIVRADRANVALLTAEGDYFEVFALQNSPDDILDGRRLPVWQSAAGMAARDRRVINTPDLHLDNFSDNQKLAEQGLRSSLVAPIQVGDKIFGSLSVAS